LALAVGGEASSSPLERRRGGGFNIKQKTTLTGKKLTANLYSVEDLQWKKS